MMSEKICMWALNDDDGYEFETFVIGCMKDTIYVIRGHQNPGYDPYNYCPKCGGEIKRVKAIINPNDNTSD